MRLAKITFILSLLGILLLIFLTQTTKQTQIATIESIKSSNNKIIIQIENNSAELIIFNTPFTNLKKGDIIEFQGRQDIYKNRTQIIVDELTKKSPPQ
jgi:DNA/RNA endonuclease YhcR with UshA esterase domain